MKSPMEAPRRHVQFRALVKTSPPTGRAAPAAKASVSGAAGGPTYTSAATSGLKSLYGSISRCVLTFSLPVCAALIALRELFVDLLPGSGAMRRRLGGLCSWDSYLARPATPGAVEIALVNSAVTPSSIWRALSRRGFVRNRSFFSAVLFSSRSRHRTNRHRVNRSGNWQLNRALYVHV